MANLIDRQEIIGWLKKVGRFMKCCENTKQMRETIGGIISHIEKIPAVDAELVKRGRWVYDHWCEFKCSACGEWSKSEPYRGKENFCPNCGAKMDLEEVAPENMARPTEG